MQWRSIVDRWIGAEPLDDPLSPDPETGLVGAVVVTGGSDGIGFEIAAEFVDRGHRVVLVARTEDALQRAVHRLRDRSSKAAVSM
ncbi:MAG: SDR family NAD(P)-dependent oxidoreductase, partial [Pseudomonadota bacterium]